MSFSTTTNTKTPIHLLLDQVRSGHNVGSVFRTSDAFNISFLYLSGLTPVPPNREVLKTALGATQSVKWSHHDNTATLIQQLKSEGKMVIAIEQTLKSQPLHMFSPPANKELVFVFGNEVHGILPEIVALCDLALEIPQFGMKQSMNISVCAGIVLYDISNKLERG